MLSRREKLLVQPWEERRFKDHRQKTSWSRVTRSHSHQQVERARAAVDAAAPGARPHVAVKLKRRQREHERRDKLTADNFALLQRLARLVRTTRLDNRWLRPLPNFHQKVGVFYEPGVLRRRVEERARSPPARAPPLAGGKCYACEFRKMKNNTCEALEGELKLPSI